MLSGRELMLRQKKRVLWQRKGAEWQGIDVEAPKKNGCWGKEKGLESKGVPDIGAERGAEDTEWHWMTKTGS